MSKINVSYAFNTIRNFLIIYQELIQFAFNIFNKEPINKFNIR